MAEEPEAEGEDAEGEDGEEGGKKKGKPKLMTLVLFAGLPALVLILGGAAAAMFLLGGGEDEAHVAEAGEHGEAAEGEHGAASDAHAGAAAHDVVFYELPEILVNIQSSDGRASYLKLSISLELDSEETAHRIEPALPRIMDRYLSFLRELRTEELVGSSANYRLHLELLRRVNLAVAPDRVQAVLIEDMLIQ
ncbi:MAG: flagellar basal body-associated FliL family protein [Maricaulaceae bacterium]|jgi:flagellar FliL protein